MLPALTERVVSARNAAAEELGSLGGENPTTPAAQGAVLLNLLHTYAHAVIKAIDGDGEKMPTSELVGGARVHHVLQGIFVQGLMALDPTGDLSDDDIRTAITNAAGAKAVLLLSDQPFELLVRAAIAGLEPPCRQCVQLVHTELISIARGALGPAIMRYPGLARALEEATLECLSSGATPATQMIESLVQCQLAYINTCHPRFVGSTAAMSQAQDELRTEREQAAQMQREIAEHGQISAGERTPLSPRAQLNKAEGLKSIRPGNTDGGKENAMRESASNSSVRRLVDTMQG